MLNLTINFKRSHAAKTKREILHELHHMAELGRLSASLLHEISNPLSAALIRIEESYDKNSPALKEARRSMRLLKNYVEAARQQVRHESQPIDFKLQEQISQVKRVVVPLAKQAGVQLKFDIFDKNSRLYGDPVKFQQIVANLAVNAIEAYGNDLVPSLDKPVRVSVKIKRNELTIKVMDCGHGIAAKNLPKIFEPFFTTKSTNGKGLGIGLALVKEYVTCDFGGSLSVRSSRRSGTIFTVKFRLARSN